RAFYAALESLDIGAMAQVWADDDAIQCVHPGGELLAGKAKVLGSWAVIFDSTDGIRFDLSDVQVQVAGDTAWVTLVERIVTDVDDEALEAAATATNLFVRRDGQWRLMLHHASPLQRRFYPEGA
ncbi:MAG: nuclear transport factor 2 family protein, partial [Planctomycetota bacterium]